MKFSIPQAKHLLLQNYTSLPLPLNTHTHTPVEKGDGTLNV